MRALVLRADWDPRPEYELSQWEKRTGKAVTGSSVWRNPRLQVEEVPTPVLEPEEVLVRVSACGVCGSDVHFYETDADGYMLYPGLTRFPSVIGHEFSGVVADRGAAVSDLEVGDLVTAEEMIWCGHCVPCRNGFPNQCRNLEEIGFTIDGAAAEYIAIGAKYCWKLNSVAERLGDPGRALELGAMTEPASVAYNAMFEVAGGFRPGKYVAVFGAGPIGLASIALARAAGAGRIVGFEVSPVRRELALRVGADLAYDPAQVRPSQVLMEHSGGEGFDFMVEAAGAPQHTVPEMEQALAIGAKVVQIGRAATRVPMYLEQLQVRKAKVFGAQGHSGYGNFPNAIRLMASGRLDLSPIITSRFRLDEGVAAIQQATRREDGKILITVGERREGVEETGVEE